MSKFKIVNLFDKIFVSVAVFLIIYAWINFFIRDLFTTFILSLIFSAGVVFLIFFIFNKRKEKTINTKKYLKDVDEKFLAFRLLNLKEQLILLKSIVEKNFTTRIIGENLVLKKDKKTQLVIIATSIQKIDEYSFVNLIKGTPKVDQIEIICNDFENNINTKIFKDTTIVFTTKKKLYDEYFFKYVIYPDCSNLNIQKGKIKLKEIMKNLFVPSKAKSYFLCGLILIFSSIILPYHTYYLIFGSTLLIFSIVCKLQPLFKR